MIPLWRQGQPPRVDQELPCWWEPTSTGRRTNIGPATVTSGVPQGSVLGHLLFLLYINDMPQKVDSISGFFADDTLLYRKMLTIHDSQILQDDIDKLQQWEKDWKMSFNPSKCEVIRITRKWKPIAATYAIHGSNLTLVKTRKYLGVTTAGNLTWNSHVDAITKNANKTLAFLMKNLSSCSTNIKAKCYKALVRPILEYASISWDPHTKTNIQKLEAVQRWAASWGLQDHQQYQSDDQQTRLGIPATEKDNFQDSHDVPCHTPSHRHPSGHVITSCYTHHTRSQHALSSPLLQDICA